MAERQVLYWFSGTGNSYHAAEQIAVQCKGDWQVKPMAACVDGRQSIEEAEVTGLVFPVYAWGLPRIVADLVAQLQPVRRGYVFAVLTYAGNAGGAVKLLRGILSDSGMPLDAAWGLKMPSSFIAMGKPMTERQQSRCLADAEERLADIAVEIDGRQTVVDVHSSWLFRMLGSLIWPLFSKAVAGSDKQFKVTDDCNGCRVCARICPVGNIRIESDRPVWQHRCQQCMACLHWCAQRAIYVNDASLAKPRYHHPACCAEDLMIPRSSR